LCEKECERKRDREGVKEENEERENNKKLLIM
jgi:hypothetical protein